MCLVNPASVRRLGCASIGSRSSRRTSECSKWIPSRSLDHVIPNYVLDMPLSVRRLDHLLVTQVRSQALITLRHFVVFCHHKSPCHSNEITLKLEIRFHVVLEHLVTLLHLRKDLGHVETGVQLVLAQFEKLLFLFQLAVPLGASTAAE